MKLYFVRHGRTLWNLEGRFQGASGDSPLLLESIDTPSKQLGQYLKEIPFDAIYSSDLPRAVKSAEIIQGSQLQSRCPLRSFLTREWQLGKLEGLRIATLNAIYPQQIKAFPLLIWLSLIRGCLKPNLSTLRLSEPFSLSNL